jgi:hypothetical protein
MESPATEILTRWKKFTIATAQSRQAIFHRVRLGAFIKTFGKTRQDLQD